MYTSGLLLSNEPNDSFHLADANVYRVPTFGQPLLRDVATNGRRRIASPDKKSILKKLSKMKFWEVLAQLAERPLSTPEVRGWHPVIGQFSLRIFDTVNCIEETKIKRGRKWP